MEKAEFPLFSACLLKTYLIYDKPVSAAFCEAFFEVVQHYPLAAVQSAMHKHLTDPDSGQFPPKPADILKNMQGTGGSKSAYAWGLVLKAIRAGANSPQFPNDPAIRPAIHSLGGWQRLKMMDWKDEPFLAKRFEEVYGAPNQSALEMDQERSALTHEG